MRPDRRSLDRVILEGVPLLGERCLTCLGDFGSRDASCSPRALPSMGFRTVPRGVGSLSFHHDQGRVHAREKENANVGAPPLPVPDFGTGFACCLSACPYYVGGQAKADIQHYPDGCLSRACPTLSGQAEHDPWRRRREAASSSRKGVAERSPAGVSSRRKPRSRAPSAGTLLRAGVPRERESLSRGIDRGQTSVTMW